MSYTFPSNAGTRFDYKGWRIGLCMTEDASNFGTTFACGLVDHDNSFTVVFVVDGPHPASVWAQKIAAAPPTGGMGNYIMSKWPVINAGLEKHFDATPPAPAVTNASPYTRDGFNAVLQRWIGMEESATNDCPKLKFIP